VADFSTSLGAQAASSALLFDRGHRALAPVTLALLRKSDELLAYEALFLLGKALPRPYVLPLPQLRGKSIFAPAAGDGGSSDGGEAGCDAPAIECEGDIVSCADSERLFDDSTRQWLSSYLLRRGVLSLSASLVPVAPSSATKSAASGAAAEGAAEGAAKGDTAGAGDASPASTAADAGTVGGAEAAGEAATDSQRLLLTSDCALASDLLLWLSERKRQPIETCLGIKLAPPAELQ
jgi:hypothetical protein